jgi:hypothetical protein
MREKILKALFLVVCSGVRHVSDTDFLSGALPLNSRHLCSRNQTPKWMELQNFDMCLFFSGRMSSLQKENIYNKYLETFKSLFRKI